MASTSSSNQSCSQLEQLRKFLIISTLKKFEETIKNNDIVGLNKLINFLYQRGDLQTLASIYEDESNPLRETHLITLACKYNKPDVLEYLLHKSNILCYLPNRGCVVEKAFTQAVCETIRTFNMEMLESLYDHWSGDIHWIGHVKRNDSKSVIQTLQYLRKLLINARDCDECKKHLIKEYNTQILININCLISFNLFQIELYTELSQLTPNRTGQDQRLNEVETIKSCLLKALEIYEKYSSERLSYTLGDCRDGLCYMCYLSCELYYRKLDYNIALLIANNIHVLKLRLVLPENVYQKIECAVYYFLYRVKENWKCYLPENIQRLKDLIHDPSNEHNKDTFENYYSIGTILFHEWSEYKHHLKKFKEALEDRQVNIRQQQSKLSNDEINSLLLWPCMRDDFSIKKILQYLEQVSYLDFKQDKMNSIFVIQRVIQMTGEFIKSSPETTHLSTTTLALINLNVPKSVSRQLRELRNIFSKTWDGRLVRRIYLEENEENIFFDVLNDLDQLIKAMKEVLATYKPCLELYLTEVGLQLIKARFASIGHPEAMVHKNDIYDLFVKCFTYKTYDQFCNKDLPDYVGKHESWLTEKLFKKIAIYEITSKKLKNRVKKHAKWIKDTLMKNIPKYTKTILQTIDEIEKQNNYWESVSQDFIKIQPSISLKCYPNAESVENINAKLKELKTQKAFVRDIKDIRNKLKNVQYFTDEWNEIKVIIDFIVVQARFMKNYKHLKSFSYKIRNIPDNNGTRSVRDFFVYLSKCSKIYLTNNNAMIQILPRNHSEYQGINNLANKMKSKYFLTMKEIDYLKSNMTNICDCGANNNNNCYHRKILEKVYDNTKINESEHASLTSLNNLNKKCKRILKNIVNGGTRSNNSLECLVNRINLLDLTMTGERTVEKNVLRYQQDIKFRYVMEMLISDIMNIFENNKNLTGLLNQNYSKLLAEYPLRNLLCHGNPLLDICSYTLDVNDFPKALLRFALDIVEDKSQLNDLLALFDDDVDQDKVKAPSSYNLTDVQNGLVSNFKTSKNWEIYLNLLPKASLSH